VSDWPQGYSTSVPSAPRRRYIIAMSTPADALDRFVPLPENRAAFRAIAQLAEAIARDIDSPLHFLHGPPGCGKSHLIAGLIERVSEGESAKTAISVAAAEFGRALLLPPLDRAAAARDALDCDLLVVEDAQHLPLAASDELASVLDRRLARRKTVVVTASRSAAELDCSARLAGRFAGGLSIAMQPLSEPSRRELAAALCRERKLQVTDEVVGWLARDPGGARPILGEVTRLVQLAKGCKPPITLAKVRSELSALADEQTPIARIVELVAARCQIPPKALAGPSRVANVAHARHLAMYLARQAGLTLVEIGRNLGGRDHTTVMHACGKMAAAIAADPKLAQQVRDLRSELL